MGLGMKFRRRRSEQPAAELRPNAELSDRIAAFAMCYLAPRDAQRYADTVARTLVADGLDDEETVGKFLLMLAERRGI